MRPRDPCWGMRVRNSTTGCTAPALPPTLRHQRWWGKTDVLSFILTARPPLCLTSPHTQEARCPSLYCLVAFTMTKRKIRHGFKYQERVSHRKGSAAHFTGFIMTMEAHILCAILDHWHHESSTGPYVCYYQYAWIYCCVGAYYVCLCVCLQRAGDNHEDLVLSFHFLYGFGDQLKSTQQAPF